MTESGKQPQQQDPADVLFICSLEDLNSLHDYLSSAIAGDDISELPRLWNQQIGVIRSRPILQHRLERGLRAVILGCKSEDLNCIAFLIREEKRQIAFHSQNLSRLRDQAKRLGVENIGEFEDTLDGW